jgi:hypothetical protein
VTNQDEDKALWILLCVLIVLVALLVMCSGNPTLFPSLREWTSGTFGALLGLMRSSEKRSGDK